MSTLHKEDTLQAIYEDLPDTHPEEWAAIQKQWDKGEGSLGDCMDARCDLAKKIYEEQAL